MQEKQNGILSQFSCLLNTYAEGDVQSDFFKLCKFYVQREELFPDNKEILLAKLKLWKMNIKDMEIMCAIHAYIMCDVEFYPHVTRLLKILCSLAFTTSTNKRLNGLALLNISRPLNINIDDILQELCLQPRRIEFSIRFMYVK